MTSEVRSCSGYVTVASGGNGTIAMSDDADSRDSDDMVAWAGGPSRSVLTSKVRSCSGCVTVASGGNDTIAMSDDADSTDSNDMVAWQAGGPSRSVLTSEGRSCSGWDSLKTEGTALNLSRLLPSCVKSVFKKCLLQMWLNWLAFHLFL